MPAPRRVSDPVFRSAALQRRAAKIEILLLDVDGVLTDGSIILDDRGVETKAFHVRDGSAIKFWQQLGKRVALITGRTSRVLELRAKELGIHDVWQGVRDKRTAMQEILAAQGLQPAQACFVGDDLPDLPALREAGLAVAVADCCPEVGQRVHYVTQTPGGRGAVREVIEAILKAQGRWNEVLAHFA